MYLCVCIYIHVYHSTQLCVMYVCIYMYTINYQTWICDNGSSTTGPASVQANAHCQ